MLKLSDFPSCNRGGNHTREKSFPQKRMCDEWLNDYFFFLF